MSSDNLTITERLTNVAARANVLCDTVQQQIGNINSTLGSKIAEVDTKVNHSQEQLDTNFNNLKNGLVETINGVDVFKEGVTKRFSVKARLNVGANGSNAPADIDPYYVNLIEFDADHDGADGNFGGGDRFKCDFFMEHRGSVGIFDHIIINGSSSLDRVSAYIEVKKVFKDNVVKLYISEPGSDPREISITKADEGKTLDVFFRQANRNLGAGRARVTLKIEKKDFTEMHRDFLAQCEYSSIYGRPCVYRVTQTPPSWDQ
ncbi:hypothetical protein [Pseudoalteromonas luteoviolacea]|uniref:Uncharacterized protein n=1 Tax=Pseudoalteromonas luteoviolacea NCIMB 1942 TaxID=1365253 RepID=A0A167G004_9GAMM|nr:hypothetical protein [Pseudoalteromonas luteoviolacea]KZN53433.1 hypothetical protein N482_24935 [Pseudoalteromonas luteoviolacea NCIMB 1942]